MASSMQFEVRGFEQLQQRIAKGDATLRVTLNEGLRAIGKLFVPAKGTGPLARETPKVAGKLARSTFFMITGGTRHQQLIIMQPARSEEGKFYGEFVREGTGIYGPIGSPITPKDKQYLHFFIGEQEFFVKSVKGQKPNPYHRRVLAQKKPEVQQIVTRMGRKITAYLSGKGGS